MRLVLRADTSPVIFTGAEAYVVAGQTTELIGSATEEFPGPLRKVMDAGPWTRARLHVNHTEDEGTIPAGRVWGMQYSIDGGTSWGTLCTVPAAEHILPGTGDTGDWTDVPVADPLSLGNATEAAGWPESGDVLIRPVVTWDATDDPAPAWNLFAWELEFST